MTFCELDIADYTLRNCGIDTAGIVGIGIIDIHENPTQENLEDPDFWTAKALEDPLKYWVIRNTRGQYDEVEPIEEEDLQGSIVTGARHQAVIDVPDLQSNRDFWDSIQKHNWKLVLITSGDLLYYVDKPVSFYPKIVNPKGIKQEAFFQVGMKWYDFSNPGIYYTPSGIFTGNVPVTPTGDGIFDYSFDYSFE
jgi:hypothetical protein